MLFGFLAIAAAERDWQWQSCLLSELARPGWDGTTVIRDTTLKPGRLTDIITLPYDALPEHK